MLFSLSHEFKKEIYYLKDKNYKKIMLKLLDGLPKYFYIIGENDEGNLVSLSRDKIEQYKERFWEIEEYSTTDVEEAMLLRFFYIWLSNDPPMNRL